ncbi:MAG: peptidase E [Oceanihabitans sp.]|nr:peptidase E [Oceanihabitans sp.]
MKNLKFALVLLMIPMFAFTAVHKYYVSVTKVEYVKEKESVQIISRIFIDDFEKLLRERYDEKITLDVEDEISTVNMYIERYLKDKLQININGKFENFNFLGKEYEEDIIFCYLEIEGIKEIKSFQITNRILMDIFEEQENIIRTNINGKKKSLLLRKGNDKGVLNFN